MDRDEIKAHWRDWAGTYGTSLRATTKTSTLKELELDALNRAFGRVVQENPDAVSVLEVGCGNGENCLHLAKAFPTMRFTGVDFISEMIEAAKVRRKEQNLAAERLRLLVADILDPDAPLERHYDLIFTDRCLINLNTDLLQCQALEVLCDHLRDGGYLVMIENNKTTYNQQNHARELLGLPPRVPAEFNHFFDEAVILPHLEKNCSMEILDIEDFISLHDLMLYVLIPALNGGKVDYQHPLMEISTSLNKLMSGFQSSAFGKFGQNRLYFCRKRR